MVTSLIIDLLDGTQVLTALSSNSNALVSSSLQQSIN
jgi:hypothetical protein